MASVQSSSITPKTIKLTISGLDSETERIYLKIIGVDGEGYAEVISPSELVECTDSCGSHIEVLFDTPKFRPICSVYPILRKADGNIENVQTGSGYNLDLLLPIDQRDLSRLIFHKSSRVKDEPTLCFILEQIMNSTLNNYFERIESVKILAYRVLEGVKVAEISTALERVSRALDWVGQLPDEFGIAKTSRYQSRISLLYIRYLLHLFNDDGPAVLCEMDEIFNSTDSVAECPIAAYNLCLCLLVRGLIQAELGLESEARLSWLEVIRLFRVAAAHMPSSKPATFVELTVSFEAAKQAAWAIEALRSKRSSPATRLDAERAATSFSRLRSPRATTFMAARIRSIVAQLASPRDTPVIAIG